jgi:hypothetical protein
MPTPTGADDPFRLHELYETARDADGEQVTQGRHP